MSTPSPISSAFTSPSKQSPNSHPYAIKSSSSGILTRSASSPNRTSTQHHYVPLITASPSPRKGRYVVSRKHSYPTVGATPSPIPTPDIPPTPPLTLRVQRRETAPATSWTSRSDTEQSLPANPKLWTPSHLAAYLSSALRLTGDAKLPVPVARDIAAFVVKERLSGRAFLRMTKEDYDSLGINTLWKSALSDASRSLRQNLVQGRIMGFGNGTSTSLDDLSLDVDEEDDDLQFSLDPTHTAASHTRSPSSYTPWDRKRTLGRFKAGRVKGMVENFERSSSESGSGSEGEWGIWKAKSGESGSEDGDREVEVEIDYSELKEENEKGGSASEDGIVPAFDSKETNVQLRMVTSTSTAELLVQPESAPEESSILLEYLPKIESTVDTSMSTIANADPEPKAESEPSVQTLLTASSNIETGLRPRSWGAKAWEDDEVHATAKRVPLPKDNAGSGMAVGAENVKELGTVEEGSVKRVKGRKKVKRAEGLAKLFEGHTDGTVKCGEIENEREKKIKDGVVWGVANKSDSESGTAINDSKNGSEIFAQQTAEHSTSPLLLDSTPATREDKLEDESEVISHDLRPDPHSSLDVNVPSPVLDDNSDLVTTLVQQTPRGSFSQFALDPALATCKYEPEAESTFANLDFHSGQRLSPNVNEPSPILAAASSSSPHLPTEMDMSSLKSEVSMPQHLPPKLPVDEGILVSPPVIPASSPKYSSLLLESLPAQSTPDLTALIVSTSALQTVLVTFQERLEIVENRLEELEAREAEREAELERLQAYEKERAARAEREDIKTDTCDLITDSEGVSSPKNYAAPDLSLGSLPLYVLIASLGITSVVVGSLVKFGRKRK